MKKEQENSLADRLSFIASIINDYEETCEETPETLNQLLLNVVFTLKCWANPSSTYQEDAEIAKDKEFQIIKDYLQDPEKVFLPQAVDLDETDKEKIRKLIRLKLEELATILINKHKLVLPTENISNSAASNWWDSKSESEKAKIENEYEAYRAYRAREATIPNAIPLAAPVPNSVPYATAVPNAIPYAAYAKPTDRSRRPVNPRAYYYFSQHSALCDYLILRDTLRVGEFGIKLSVAAAYAAVKTIEVVGKTTGTLVANLANLAPGKSRMRDSEKQAIASAVGLALLVVHGVVGGAYALYKSYKSMANLFSGKKVLRSLYRLVGAAGGGCGGALAGITSGATLGSAIPGVGTALGAVLGGISGAGVGAAIGAAITKYTARLISWFYHPNAINPTNPEKYELTEKQENNFHNKVIDLNDVDEIICAIRAEKKKIGFTFLFTAARKEQNRLSDLLEQVKNGGLVDTKIVAGGYTYMLRSLPVGVYSSTAQVQQSFGGNGDLGYVNIPGMPEPSAPVFELFNNNNVVVNIDNGYQSVQRPAWG